MLMNWKFISTKINQILLCNRREQLIKLCINNNWGNYSELTYNELKKCLIIEVLEGEKK